MIGHCLHYGFNGPVAPNWTDIRTVLELHDLWTPVIQGKLSTCFGERFKLIRAEQERQASIKPPKMQHPRKR